MSAEMPNVRQVQGYCGLCIARCGTVATVTDGKFTGLAPDPTHPTGAAICAKGRAAPELVYHNDRLKRPLRRTRPKGDADPGWEEISWDAALDQIAAAMRRIAEQHGPEAVAFSQSSPSTTAIADSAAFVVRLMNAFGTPNHVSALELCGWGRGYATRYVFGVGSVATGSAGGAMANIAESGCLILWGYNPSFTRITHATATVAGLKRGMKLIVIDPRNAGLANKATSRRADDGLALRGVRVAAAVRCAPPANKPTPEEQATCRPYLVRELALLPDVRVLVALGAIGWDAALRTLEARGVAVPKRPRPEFAHGAEVTLEAYTLVGTYHPSQQNTFTGKLTLQMLQDVLERAKELAGIR